MSMETSEWLNRFCLIGMTDKRGTAWHYRQSDQGDEPNHYPGFIPVDDVLRRLFSWTVDDEPIYRKTKSGLFVALNDRKAMFRSDEPEGNDALGVFKGGYVGHGYSEWLLDLVAEILGTDLGITSAGLLKRGGLAWVEVSVPENITTPEGVTFRPNLLAGTSFDGSLATTYKRTAQETVCDNTMAASLASVGEQLKIRHSKYSGTRIADARDTLALVVDQADTFSAQVATLCNVKVSDKSFGLVLDELIPTPENPGRGATLASNKRDILTQLYNNDSRVKPWKGTAFGVLQMDNTYRHHFSIVRGVDGGKAERNMQNALLGNTGDADDKIIRIIAKVTNDKLLKDLAAA